MNWFEICVLLIWNLRHLVLHNRCSQAWPGWLTRGGKVVARVLHRVWFVKWLRVAVVTEENLNAARTRGRITRTVTSDPVYGLSLDTRVCLLWVVDLSIAQFYYPGDRWTVEQTDLWAVCCWRHKWACQAFEECVVESDAWILKMFRNLFAKISNKIWVWTSLKRVSINTPDSPRLNFKRSKIITIESKTWT